MLPAKLFGREKVSSFRKILIIRIDHIGDVINSTAVLAPLKNRFPEARIDFLVSTHAAAIVKHNTDIDNVISFDAPWFVRRSSGSRRRERPGLRQMTRIIDRGGYDLCIDLRGDFRHILAMYLAGVKRRVSYGITGGGFLLTDNVPYDGCMHEIERDLALLKDIGIAGDEGRVVLSFSEQDRENACCMVRHSGIDHGYAVLHVSPGHKTKVWDAQGFADTARYLFYDKGFVPVIVGGNGDAKNTAEIKNIVGENIPLADFTGKTTLGVLYNILRGARLFVGVDSAPGHMAAAAGIPVVTIFSGVNDPAQWAPRGDNVVLVCPGRKRDLSSLKMGEVRSAVDKVLAETRVRGAR